MANRRLEVFYTVARHLSFTKAGEQLFMTQPAVTFQIKQLEEQFNTRLFERSHGKIALTPAGQMVMSYAERILGLSEEMETRIADLTGAIGGPLLLGASLTIAEYILPRILGEFKAQHSQVHAHMTVGNSELIETRVADHTLDLGLIETPAHLPGLRTEVCCEDELVVICAPDHKFAKSRDVKPQQILDEPYISRETGSGTREFADQYLRRCNVMPEDLNIVMELGSLEAIKGVVETGLGVSIVSRATAAKERQLGTLVMVQLEPRLIRTFSFVHLKEKFRSRLLTAFVEFATSRMKALSGSA
ncbi:MAG: LysR family transcriptional regulator [Betaproteobacteria bacterium]|nr:LysR family transcriptional regulator [Betaproteobacteria bacterium]MDH3438555.1 LysR family transcriptional regulator [Betaproteobacteria bacterium]